jgi:hypothetical protein
LNDAQLKRQDRDELLDAKAGKESRLRASHASSIEDASPEVVMVMVVTRAWDG